MNLSCVDETPAHAEEVRDAAGQLCQGYHDVDFESGWVRLEFAFHLILYCTARTVFLYDKGVLGFSAIHTESKIAG